MDRDDADADPLGKIVLDRAQEGPQPDRAVPVNLAICVEVQVIRVLLLGIHRVICGHPDRTPHSKDLYKRVLAGEITNFTGTGQAHEPPEVSADRVREKLRVYPVQ